MTDLVPRSCWVLTEGHAGMQNQCIGLAEALGLQPVVKQVVPTAPWKWLPPGLWRQPLAMAAPDTPLTSPWPRVLISCGRRSVAAAMAVRQAARGQTFAIHIQAPHVGAERFDALVVPAHDSLRADNVLVVRGALHHVTKAKLAAAATAFAPLFAELPRPIIGVLVGGANRSQNYTPAVTAALADQLVAAAGQAGGSVAVTPSRRTDDATKAMLRRRLDAGGIATYFWDGHGDNPYFGLLALADVIVVTSDSVSMVSEACSTGKPVYIFDIPGGSPRLRRFNQELIADRLAAAFTGSVAGWDGEGWAGRQVLDETARAAAFLRSRITATDR